MALNKQNLKDELSKFMDPQSSLFTKYVSNKAEFSIKFSAALIDYLRDANPRPSNAILTAQTTVTANAIRGVMDNQFRTKIGPVITSSINRIATSAGSTRNLTPKFPSSKVDLNTAFEISTTKTAKQTIDLIADGVHSYSTGTKFRHNETNTITQWR